MSDSDSDESVGARAARDRLQPGTQEDYNNALQHIEDYVKETYTREHEVYQRCMENDKLKMPVDFALSKLFLRDKVQNRLMPWPDDSRESSRRTFQKHLSLSTMTTAVSALKYSYRRNRTIIPPEVAEDYENIWQEYKLFVGNERMNGDMPMVEGAAAITWDAFHMLLEAAISAKPSGRGSAESSIVNLWLFLIIAWTTLCRGERVGRVQLSFIQWCGDALGIQVPTSKSDAAGLMSYMKLCYANCLDFTSCVVTALGARICAGLQDAQFLFGTGVGEAQYVVTRMRAALAELVFLLPATADAVLQVKRSLLTLHMPKKSGIKHCNSCGITGMNTPIHLRADHKMGPYDLASDCDGVLGRILADLKPFDLPPPHFHPAIAAAVPWSDFIPSYREFPEKFKLAIPNIVASVVWHHTALSARLPPSNPLLGSPLFTTHRFMLTRLFPYLLGGTSGSSLLTKSGRNILMEVADDVNTLMRREMQLSVPSQNSLKISDEQMKQLQECIMSSKNQPVERLLTAAQFENLQGLLAETATPSQPLCPGAAAPSNSASWANVMPLLFLQSDFRFPVGLSLEDAYRRWFCAVPPLPALHLITAKMIPPCETKQHRKAQKSLRSKFAGCMQVIHGLTPPGICRRNVAFTWSIFWPRVVSLYSIREPCSWTVATAFQKFYSDKSKHATAINMPALAVEDVPVSCSEPSVAWTAATSISETATAQQRADKSSRAPNDDGRRRSSVVQQRTEAHAAVELVSELAGAFSSAHPPCPPSMRARASHVDSSSDDESATTWVVRYKCPFATCDKHFGTTSGIRKHWGTCHDPVPVPRITEEGTRTQIDSRLVNKP
jgi:hypothetical protein